MCLSAVKFLQQTEPGNSIKYFASQIITSLKRPVSICHSSVGSHGSQRSIDRYFSKLHGQIQRSMTKKMSSSVPMSVEPGSEGVTDVSLNSKRNATDLPGC